MAYVLGIDIGGTFTDACAISDDGDVLAAKTPSTPPDYGVGVLNSVAELASLLGSSAEALLEDTAYICHGTTSTLNALVTGDVADVGLLTTKGHADSIVIMNIEGRYAGLDAEVVQDMLRTRKPEPLVASGRIREVVERIDYAGEAVVPLDELGVAQAVRDLAAEGVDAIAVSLLWSFRNPEHERRVREIVAAEAPELYVALSSEISPRIGEYGRSATTIMSTQVGPRLERYLLSLEGVLAERGFAGKLLVMQGSGGVVSANDASRHAIGTIGSVLTGGVVGATTLGEQLGHDNIIATDMGGTTFLVGLVQDGKPLTASRTVLGQHQINVPMVQIHTIGSGGGAIAWVDGGGNLRVGPRSAQAKPGPACYGAGGIEPTITDADVVLGLIDPESFLGGRMRLDVDIARASIQTHVAEPLKMSIEDAAAAIFAIANAQAADAVRQVVVNNGHDPRDFVLYSYGGAGPVHCAHYAAELGVAEVIVPLGPTASAFSAFGLAASDVIITVERSAPQNFPLAADEINVLFAQLETEAEDRVKGQGLVFDRIDMQREIDIRYSLQLAEVPTPVKSGKLTDDLADVLRDFEALYEQIYGPGTGFAGAGAQAITFRARAVGKLAAKPRLPELAAAAGGGSPPLKGERKVHLDITRGWETAQVYDYRALAAGQLLVGPALIEAPATTVVVPGDAVGRVDALGNLVITTTTGDQR